MKFWKTDTVPIRSNLKPELIPTKCWVYIWGLLRVYILKICVQFGFAWIHSGFTWGYLWFAFGVLFKWFFILLPVFPPLVFSKYTCITSITLPTFAYSYLCVLLKFSCASLPQGSTSDRDLIAGFTWGFLSDQYCT